MLSFKRPVLTSSLFSSSQKRAKIQGNTRQSDFIYKGKTGRWEEVYSKETIKRFEEWETKWLDGTGLSFTYKL